MTRSQRFLAWVYGVAFVGMALLNAASLSDRDKARTERDQAVSAKNAVVESCRLKVDATGVVIAR